jgi:hypothetical protein
MKITRDSEFCGDSVRIVLNYSSRSESMHLQDVRALKLESRPHAFRRFCAEWMKHDLNAQVEVIETQIPDVATEISEESTDIRLRDISSSQRTEGNY